MPLKNLMCEAGMPATKDNYELIDTRELNRRTGLSTSTIRRYRELGILEAIQPGGPGRRLLFRSDAVEQAASIFDNLSSLDQPSAFVASRSLNGPQPRWMRMPAS